MASGFNRYQLKCIDSDIDDESTDSELTSGLHNLQLSDGLSCVFGAIVGGLAGYSFKKLLSPDKQAGKTNISEFEAVAKGAILGGLAGIGLNKCIQRNLDEQEQVEKEFLKDPVTQYVNDCTCPIGCTLNLWQEPIKDACGKNDIEWEKNIKTSTFVSNMNFSSKEWARARDVVDKVMAMLRKTMDEKARHKYKHLRIDSYVRQGSSRDGLKIIAPDEFDTIVQFHIDGLEHCLEEVGTEMPGFCYIKVINRSKDWLMQQYPRLLKEMVFSYYGDESVYLNSKRLQEVVFKSLVDSSCSSIQQIVNDKVIATNDKAVFRITRRINPPSVNITIQYNDYAAEYFMTEGAIKNKTDKMREINLDLVLALCLRHDSQTQYQGTEFNCPIHAVCKWAEEESVKALGFARSDLIWHLSTAGYEKHILDLARLDQQRQQYILMALRMIKTVFANLRNSESPPPQITTVLSSYHLKQITFYLIQYLCHLNQSIRIDGVQDALKYYLAFLKVTLEEKQLPHFFYSNSQINGICRFFPKPNSVKRYNLLQSKSRESLNQAKLSLMNLVYPNLGITATVNGDIETIVQSYRWEISY